MNIYTVIITKSAKKDLEKVPKYIALKLVAWIEAVSHDGLLEVRKIPGFDDEPLKGNRNGQRSIRLSKGYPAIYEIGKNGEMEIVEILEVNKHDY
ncbi:type II toxin-antitoxin system RelE family toxin [Legionella hackeliae]|uniref:Plasmid stabilisation system n=1 Tax=Legionella hackeliae TaxID=449 RepID=A0A0A8UPE6_LEGHA|nr:type II toxin-antitoxin system mRNA interferase toxin, RelE/StbE family [Legionella hackeliae]KTD11429.1 Plasmid stabilization system protein [Legionella hackeliae]CEK10745.1 Plasmid stabilisation system [Legionella hackeliae]STX47489.1 addiction module toxin, RelE/StbE family [Legionella hackeliae]